MRLSESLRTQVSSDQQGVLMEEDQRSILIIGGIQIFLPISPVEASAYVLLQMQKGQPVVTVIEGGEGEDIESSPTEKRSIQLICSLSGRRSWRCWRIG
jgi:hypothetical protein